MSMITSSSGMSGVISAAIASGDIETALLAVQSERANLLDEQLKMQLDGVKAINDNIAKLNDVLSSLAALSARVKPDKSNSSESKVTNDETTKKIIADLNQKIDAAGLSGSKIFGNSSKASLSTTKGQIEAATTAVKGLVDSQSNTQQMDMLRLQSLSNKRNEAYDTMTNFIKKMQDNRSSIVSNLR